MSQGERGPPGPSGPPGVEGCPGLRGLKVQQRLYMFLLQLTLFYSNLQQFTALCVSEL